MEISGELAKAKEEAAEAKKRKPALMSVSGETNRIRQVVAARAGVSPATAQRVLGEGFRYRYCKPSPPRVPSPRRPLPAGTTKGTDMAKKAHPVAENPKAWLHAARHIGKQRGGFLVGAGDTYAFAVEAVATILRPRFESGELAPWARNDQRWAEIDRGGDYRKIPNIQVENECSRLFITTSTAAFIVLEWASDRAKTTTERFEWREPGLNGCSVLYLAETWMSHDVIAFAKRRGWLRTTRRAA